VTKKAGEQNGYGLVKIYGFERKTRSKTEDKIRSEMRNEMRR
jgi:hypothetical protein